MNSFDRLMNRIQGTGCTCGNFDPFCIVLQGICKDVFNISIMPVTHEALCAL